MQSFLMIDSSVWYVVIVAYKKCIHDTGTYHEKISTIPAHLNDHLPDLVRAEPFEHGVERSFSLCSHLVLTSMKFFAENSLHYALHISEIISEREIKWALLQDTQVLIPL